jgi:clan AA aspartic protease
MIRGRVTADRDVTIPLDIAGPNQQWQRTEAVIDTGFNGFLTLPPALVHTLRLPLVGNRRAALGDGSVVVLDVYLATVLWHDQEREVLVLQADSDPLVGMSLLYGNRVTLYIVDDGDVLIDELP